MPKAVTKPRAMGVFTGQNGSDYRSDEELKAIANKNHAACVSCLRKTLNHIRLAGDALNEMKGRLKGTRGAWGAWLAENFDGSPESARLYMRVAANWEKIVADGLDREGVTLEQLRKHIAHTGQEQDDTTAHQAEGQPSNVSTSEPTEGENQDAPPPPKTKTVPLKLNDPDRKAFNGMIQKLQPVLNTTTTTDTVLKALQVCCEVKCDAK